MKFKKIAAVVSAAALALALAGCGKDDNGVNVDKNGNISINESKFENHVNSVFGDGETSSKVPENSVPEVKPIEMTDEIKNAALNSGLVQYNNDIFQRGGYMTVADFVEKYKDRYDITYWCPQDGKKKEAGSYDECKDYLLEYCSALCEKPSLTKYRWGKRDNSFSKYYLVLKDKNNSSLQPVIAYVVNATSPDEKITLDKAIVAEIDSRVSDYDPVTPEWFPMGVNCKAFSTRYESENKNYTVKNLYETLEAKGITKHNNFDYYEEHSLIVPAATPDNCNSYWMNNAFGTYIECYVLGEDNLFGAKPLYYYSFTIDSNTDKVTYVDCALEYFVKE